MGRHRIGDSPIRWNSARPVPAGPGAHASGWAGTDEGVALCGVSGGRKPKALAGTAGSAPMAAFALSMLIVLPKLTATNW